MIIRLTQKLSTKIKVGKLLETPLHERPIADWSANVFHLGRTQYVLLSNTSSLFTCLMTAKGLTNRDLFKQRAREAIVAAVRRFAGDAMVSDAEFDSPVLYAKSLNRSVIGSMNDLAFGARVMIDAGDDLQRTADLLNVTPLKMLTRDNGRSYNNPAVAFQRIIEEA